MSKELREINKQSKEAEQALKEVNKNLKFDPSNAEMTEKKMKLIRRLLGIS